MRPSIFLSSTNVNYIVLHSRICGIRTMTWAHLVRHNRWSGYDSAGRYSSTRLRHLDGGNLLAKLLPPAHIKGHFSGSSSIFTCEPILKPLAMSPYWMYFVAVQTSLGLAHEPPGRIARDLRIFARASWCVACSRKSCHLSSDPSYTSSAIA